MTKEQIIGLLAGALIAIDGDSKLYKDVNALMYLEIDDIINAFVAMHLKPVKLVSLAVEALTDPKYERDFLMACDEITGLG